jgi:hypothetical protein
VTQEKITPNCAGISIPEPPEQKSPWASPQTQLPEDLMSAATRLFEQGLADPRGMEYREIEVIVGVEWHTGRIVKNAWLDSPGGDFAPTLCRLLEWFGLSSRLDR